MNVFRSCVATAVVAVALAGQFAIPSRAQADGSNYLNPLPAPVAPGSNYLNPLPAPVADVYRYVLVWRNVKTGEMGKIQYNVIYYRATRNYDWSGYYQMRDLMSAMDVSPDYVYLWEYQGFWKCIYPPY
jgi:hypothetical protein